MFQVTIEAPQGTVSIQGRYPLHIANENDPLAEPIIDTRVLAVTIANMLEAFGPIGGCAGIGFAAQLIEEMGIHGQLGAFSFATRGSEEHDKAEALIDQFREIARQLSELQDAKLDVALGVEELAAA